MAASSRWRSPSDGGPSARRRPRPAPARPTRWRPALSPARKASRPISWKSWARSMGSPSLPNCSRPAAKQAAGAFAVAGVPMQPADLAAEARGAGADPRPPRALAARLRSAPERLGAPAGEPQEVGRAVRARARIWSSQSWQLGERAKRPLVMADRVGVGVNGARPVAGRHQVAGAPGLVRVRLQWWPSASRSLSRAACGPTASSRARPTRSCSSVRRASSRFS